MSERTGKWEIKDKKFVPDHVMKAFYESEPDWDWFCYEDWFVARLYEDGVENERVLCKILRTTAEE